MDNYFLVKIPSSFKYLYGHLFILGDDVKYISYTELWLKKVFKSYSLREILVGGH